MDEAEAPPTFTAGKQITLSLLTVAVVAATVPIPFLLALQTSPRLSLEVNQVERWWQIAMLLAITGVALATRRLLCKRWEAPSGSRPEHAAVLLVCIAWLLVGLAFGSAFRVNVCGTGVSRAHFVVASLSAAVAVGIGIWARVRIPTIAAAAGTLLVGLLLLALVVSSGSRDCFVNKAVQTSLRNAFVAVVMFEKELGTIEGFTPETGERLEPSLNWSPTAPIGPKTISITHADSDSILLVSYSDRRDPFCMLYSEGDASYGTIDTNDPADCDDPKW